MKRNPLMALAVTATIVAAPLWATACATTPPPMTSSPSPSTTAPTPPAASPVTYSPQVVLPFGDHINHLSGVAVDAAGNVYVLDYYYGQVWKQAPGVSRPTTLEGSVYVSDFSADRVLKLAAGAGGQTVLPFTGLDKPSALAVDGHGRVYLLDNGHFRVLKLATRS